MTKDIPLYGERVRLIEEAFNIANKPNFTTINQTPYNYTAATNIFVPAVGFGLPTNTSDPRILQVAARLTFRWPYGMIFIAIWLSFLLT